MVRPTVAGALAALALATPVAAQCEEQKLTPADAIGGAKFGLDVDHSGPYAIAGAPFDPEAGAAAGAAYVFEHGPSGWTEVTKFVASDAEELDRTGWRVGIDGETAVVATRYTEDNGYGTGSVYVLEREPGGTWPETAKLLADDAEPFSFFGNDADVSDAGIVVVGAPSDDDLGALAGAIYVFEKSGPTWSQTAKVYGSTTTTDDRVGYSVSLDGTTFLAGSFQHDGVGPDSGVAYVFEKQGGQWIETAELVPSDASTGAAFGIDVAVAGDLAVVGAHLESSIESQAGAAYVFERIGGQWTETAKLVAPDGTDTDFFGESVAISEDGILVGAFNADAAGASSGCAYLFRREGASYEPGERVVPADLAAGDAYGTAVSIDGDTLLVGSRDDDFGLDSGATYSFSFADLMKLSSPTTAISLTTGGTQDMLLETCPVRAGYLYFVLGSVSGTQPGFDVGDLHLPLNVDFYFLLTLTEPNSYPLLQSVGVLDAAGQGPAQFGIGTGENPGLAGLLIHHAFGLVDPLGGVVPQASDPLRVTLVP